jgi:hypothetical protein
MARARKSTPLTFDDLLAMAREFPGIEESTSYGTRALKVRGKFLGRIKEDNETMVLRVEFIDRDFLMRTDPQTYFITDHYRDYPTVLIRLASADRAQLRQLIEDAWRRMAPKKLVQQFDAADERARARSK